MPVPSLKSHFSQMERWLGALVEFIIPGSTGMLPEPRKPLENKLYSAELFSFQNKTSLCAVGDVRKKVKGDAQVVQKYPWLWSMFLNLLKSCS